MRKRGYRRGLTAQIEREIPRLRGTPASSGGGSGAGAAPDDAQYLTLAVHADLTSERVFTPGFGLTETDGGAGAAYDLVVNQGMVPTWTGLHTFSAGITLNGASGANNLTIPDNTAIAVELLDAGGLEYLRIVSTDAQPIILFNEAGADVDFHIEASGVADALQIQGNDGQITLGALGAGVVQSSAGGVLSVVDPVSTLPIAPVAQGDILIADGTPEWSILSIGAQYTHPESSGVTATWSANLNMANNTTVGIIGGGRLLFNSTPAPDQIQVTDADLYFSTGGTGIIHVSGVVAGMVLRANGTRYVPDTLDVDDLTDLAYAVPALTFGTANAAGAANTVIRTDATLAIFDITVPTTIQADDAAATGAAAFAARRDHTHGFPTVAPANIGVANAEGTAYDFVRSDHVHAHPAGLGVNLHHNEVHVINSTGPHAEAGLTTGHVLRATGVAAFSFAALVAGDLPAHTHSGAGQGGSLIVGTTDTDATAGSIFFAGAAGVIQQDNTNLFWDDANNRLGVGTAPDELIHARKDQDAITTLEVENQTAGANAQAMVSIIANSTGGSIRAIDDGSASDLADKIVLYGNATSTATAIYNAAEIHLYTGGVTAANKRVVITATGNAGINIAAPSAKLHVDNDGAIAQPVFFLDQGDVSEQHIVCSINGADQDFPAILELDVTGAPRLWWDESEDFFAFDHPLAVEAETALTSTQKDVLTLQHNTSDGAAPWFGETIRFQLEDGGGTENEDAAAITAVWASETAPESGLLILNTFYNGAARGYIGTWSGAVDGVAATVIPGGTGDVTEVCRAGYAVARQGGAAGEVSTGAINGVEPGAAAQTIYTNAGNIVQVTVAAGGDVTVQRTAGAGTYDVVLWLIWI